MGTDEDQIAVAPGALRRTWTEGGRRYFRYATDAPTRAGIDPSHLLIDLKMSDDIKAERYAHRRGAASRSTSFQGRFLISTPRMEVFAASIAAQYTRWNTPEHGSIERTRS